MVDPTVAGPLIHTGHGSGETIAVVMIVLALAGIGLALYKFFKARRDNMNISGQGRGFTILELIIIIALVAVLAIFIIPRFLNMGSKATQAAEDGVVAAVRSGINNYRVESQLTSRVPLYPATLDTAANGAASISNPFFTTVLSGPIATQWNKATLLYTGPSGTEYRYDPSTGVFDFNINIPGLLAVWSMEEGSGTTTNLGNMTGTMHGGTWTTGKVGDAIHFNGAGDYLSVADNSTLDLSNAGTVAAWVYYDAMQPFAGIVHKGDMPNFSDEAYSLQMWTGNTAALSLFDTGGNNYILQSTGPLTTGQWYHLAATWDNSGMKLYVNGTLDSSNANAVTVRNSSGNLNIGAQINQDYNAAWKNLPHQGTIDEAAVYGRALTAQEIQTYYNGTK